MASPHGGAGRGMGGANRPGEAPKVAAQRLREARQNLALVVDASGRAELVRRPIPMPGPKQLLIKVETVLVQPTCVGLASGQLLPPSGTSLIPGQEFCGSIQELGSNVDKETFAEGKKVAVSPISFCDTCYFCLRGQTNLCEIGAELLGWDLDGGYQQYVCVSAKRCHVFDQLVSMRQAVLASSAAAASYGMTRVSIQPGDTVLILGSSVTALMGVAFARGLGAEYICVVGLKGSDPQKALNCGASKHIPWDPLADEAQQFATIRSALAEETENRGADAVFIPSDHGTGMLDLHVASKLVRHGGCIISIRMWDHSPPRDDDMTEAGAHMQASIVKEMTQKDMRYICAKGFSDKIFEQVLRWIEGGLLMMGPEVDAVWPLSQWEQAHNMSQGDSRPGGGKCCIMMPHAEPSQQMHRPGPDTSYFHDLNYP